MKALLSNFLRYTVSLGVLLLVWQGVVLAFHIKPFLLPAPQQVFQTLWSEAGSFAQAAAFTLQNMLYGGSLGVGFGLLAGILLAYSTSARWLGEPYLVIFQSFPRESLLPLIIVWLGFGATSKVAYAALLSFFPVAVIVLQSLKDTRLDYLQFVDSLGASRLQQFLHCRLPNSVPAILGALKVGMPLSLIGAVLSEFFGGNEGLGHIIATAGSSFRVDRVFGAVVILAAIGMFFYSIITLCERTLCRRFFHA